MLQFVPKPRVVLGHKENSITQRLAAQPSTCEATDTMEKFIP